MGKPKEVVKNVDSFSVEIADNGYIIQFSGDDENDNWVNNKRVVTNDEQLMSTIGTIVNTLR